MAALSKRVSIKKAPIRKDGRLDRWCSRSDSAAKKRLATKEVADARADRLVVWSPRSHTETKMASSSREKAARMTWWHCVRKCACGRDDCHSTCLAMLRLPVFTLAGRRRRTASRATDARTKTHDGTRRKKISSKSNVKSNLVLGSTAGPNTVSAEDAQGSGLSIACEI